VWLGKQDSNHSITLHVSLLIEPTWCAGWDFELKALFAAYVEAMQRQNVLDYDDLLLYWAQMVSGPGLAGEIGGWSTSKKIQIGSRPRSLSFPVCCAVDHGTFLPSLGALFASAFVLARTRP
jgi:hypothetical protein